MAHTDDQWIRLFNVSDPRRAYAGHTLYKVTSKVFQREFPEGATEIAVWRRFSDFKKLHHELLKIYTHKHFKEDEFPPFPKAKFFGRFEEGVIEERRKAALELLTFAGNVPDLFTSQPFVKFFEGGFPDSPARSDSLASREGSSSDAECEIPRAAISLQEDKNPDSGVQIEWQSPSPPCAASKENGDNSDEASLGGVWLYKQPSLTDLEGVDNLSSGEEDNDCQEPSDSTLPEVETEGEQNDLTRQSNEKIVLNAEEDHDDVFTDDIDKYSDNESATSERDEPASSADPPNWLVRAISICSEGEDLEALASEADTEELSFPQAFSEHGYCSSEERTDENESKNVHESEFPTYPYSDSWGDFHLQQNRTDASENLTQNSHTESHNHSGSRGIDLDKAVHSVNPPVRPEPSDSSSSTSGHSKDSHSLKDSISVGTAEDKQSFTSSSDSGRAGKAVTRQRTISDLGNIFIDRKESDYLYVAGHTIHKALECEVDGKYEEAFSLYKTCVSVLLSGVQGEKDVKRREAVRRKTAQYLLKAEALYSTYLAGNESPEKTAQDSSPSHSGTNICESDDLQAFKDLTLADLKVMGVVGKVILVENVHNGETYVVKALYKSGPARAHGHSHGSEHRRRKSVRRLFGKFPNIVRLYRYFETTSTIYLLLEYARGGRLWDHIACYQRDKESHVLENTNKRNTKDLNETTQGRPETKTVSDTDTMDVNRVSAHGMAEPLAGEGSSFKCRTDNSPTNSTRLQVSEDSAKASNDSVVQVSDLKPNRDGITVQHNGKINSSVNEINKDLDDKCGEREAEASRAHKHLVFKKLDEYFASSAQYVPHEHVRIWAAELVLAVAYLHTAGIICRDLHPRNLLLDEEGHVLVTYFGSWEEAEHIPDEEAMNHFYCAPEIWQVDEVTAAADWWSVGALLYELMTGQALSSAHPWGIKTHTELQLPNKISPEARSLLKELLRVIPSERLGSGVNGVEEIKSHPFFNGINWTWLCSRIN